MVRAWTGMSQWEQAMSTQIMANIFWFYFYWFSPLLTLVYKISSCMKWDLRGKSPGRVSFKEAKEKRKLKSQDTALACRWRTVCNPRYAWECWALREIEREEKKGRQQRRKISGRKDLTQLDQWIVWASAKPKSVQSLKYWDSSSCVPSPNAQWG